METFMDWDLMCRNEDAMSVVGGDIPSSQVIERSVHRDAEKMSSMPTAQGRMS